MQNRNRRKGNPSRVLPILAASFLFLLFFSMLNQLPWAASGILNTKGTVGHTENPWKLSLEDAVLAENLQLPEYLELERGKVYTMSTVLTYDGMRDEMPYGFLHLDHAYCRVRLDGRVLFSCMPEDTHRMSWDRSKSSGFLYKAFPLPYSCRGKLLEVEILPMFTVPVEYGLPELQFGDFSSTLYSSAVRGAPHDIVVVLCILLGTAAILFSTASLHGSEYLEGISIGIFSLLFSAYLITECRLNVYFIGNPYYTYLLNYIPFSLLPVSLMGFMRERLQEKHRKICTAVITAELVFFAAELLLHFGGILDMREIIPIIHLIYFISVALVTVLILTMKDRKKKRSLVLQLMPVLICMVIDGVIYWQHWEIGVNDATFTILGVIIFLVIEVYRVWRSTRKIYTESVRSSLYRQMAYSDELTGVGNRRSYEQEIERIAAGEKRFGTAIVASADVNRLKYVNDHFGHAAGDDIIRSGAQIMADIVGDSGRVFRIGGDEFVIFLYDVEAEGFEEMMRLMQERVGRFNNEKPYPLGLAVGYVQISDHDVLEAVRDADQRMYIDKARCREARV